jgi:hypothetical protein
MKICIVFLTISASENSMVQLVSLSLVFATLLYTCFSQSLRGKESNDRQWRDLTVQPNVIVTFSLSVVASKPTNPASVASCIAGNTQTQSVEWFNSTYPYGKVVNLSTPAIYTAGSTWPGTRRRLTTTTTTKPVSHCTYVCIIHQVAGCTLCGHRRRNQRFLSYAWDKAAADKTNKATNTTNTTVTTKPANNTNTTVTTKPANTTNTTVTTKPANTTNTTTITLLNYTHTEIALVEDIIELLLPILCPGISGISSVVFTVTEQTL